MGADHMTKMATIPILYLYYKPLADNDAIWAWPIWTPGAWLAGFIKGITKHCYTQYGINFQKSSPTELIAIILG